MFDRPSNPIAARKICIYIFIFRTSGARLAGPRTRGRYLGARGDPRGQWDTRRAHG